MCGHKIIHLPHSYSSNNSSQQYHPVKQYDISPHTHTFFLHTHQIKKAALCRAPPIMKTSPPIMIAGLRPVFSERAVSKNSFYRIVHSESGTHLLPVELPISTRWKRWKQSIPTTVMTGVDICQIDVNIPILCSLQCQWNTADWCSPGRG